MRITKSQLKELIKEEVKTLQLNEYFYEPNWELYASLEDLLKEIIMKSKEQNADNNEISKKIQDSVNRVLSNEL